MVPKKLMISNILCTVYCFERKNVLYSELCIKTYVTGRNIKVGRNLKAMSMTND